MKKLYLASDHAGFELKDKIKKYAESKGYEISDLGPFNGEDSVSYAQYGLKLGKAISKDKDSIGIGICGTGLGISYAINRVKGARGARVTSIEDAHLAKEHNNANALTFGARQITFEQAKEMFDEWEKTEYAAGRHEKRINELDE